MFKLFKWIKEDYKLHLKMKPDREQIRVLIQTAVDHSGLPHSVLCKQAGISTRTLRRWLNKETDLSLDPALALLKVCYSGPNDHPNMALNAIVDLLEECEARAKQAIKEAKEKEAKEKQAIEEAKQQEDSDKNDNP